MARPHVVLRREYIQPPRLSSTGMGLKPAYVIEFVAEVFDKLPPKQQEEVILHELLHIPKSFSGGLVPHGKSTSEERQNTKQVHLTQPPLNPAPSMSRKELRGVDLNPRTPTGAGSEPAAVTRLGDPRLRDVSVHCC
jgi:hypothetical protein